MVGKLPYSFCILKDLYYMQLLQHVPKKLKSEREATVWTLKASDVHPASSTGRIQPRCCYAWMEVYGIKREVHRLKAHQEFVKQTYPLRLIACVDLAVLSPYPTCQLKSTFHISFGHSTCEILKRSNCLQLTTAVSLKELSWWWLYSSICHGYQDRKEATTVKPAFNNKTAGLCHLQTLSQKSCCGWAGWREMNDLVMWGGTALLAAREGTLQTRCTQNRRLRKGLIPLMLILRRVFNSMAQHLVQRTAVK